MLKASHIRVAARSLQEVMREDDVRINEFIYLFGSIAPDFKTMLPPHRIETTIGRVQKKINLVKYMKPGILRSFIIGIVVHYICDYFCCAHNLLRTGIYHTAYENLLERKLKIWGYWGGEIPIEFEGLEKEYLLQTQYYTLAMNSLIDINLDNIDIGERIIRLHMGYRYELRKLILDIRSRGDKWYMSGEVARLDVRYITYVMRYVLEEILIGVGEEGI